MKISLLNERIIIQKMTSITDEIGNHLSTFSYFIKVYATISNESPSEATSSGNVWDNSKIDFTIRYSNKTSKINTKEYRILFKGNLYNIEGIDHMNYKKKAIKLHCRRINGKD